MRLIQLKLISGETTFINAENIEYLSVDDDGATLIKMSNGTRWKTSEKSYMLAARCNNTYNPDTAEITAQLERIVYNLEA